MISRLVFSVLGAISFGCAPCTEQGCVETLIIDFSEELPAGEYTLTVVADGVQGICTGQIGVDGEAPSCSGLPGLNLGWSAIYLYEPAEQVEVTLESSAGEIGQGSYAPKYKTSYPNGERCGPECSNATEVLTVTP